jgi:hypothetical protein
MNNTVTSYLGYTIHVYPDAFVVCDQEGRPVGRTYSMTGARSLVKKLRRVEGKRR